VEGERDRPEIGEDQHEHHEILQDSSFTRASLREAVL
jgi:hypothetical protein